MEELMAALRASIDDEYFSKPEKRGFKALLTHRPLRELMLVQVLAKRVFLPGANHGLHISCARAGLPLGRYAAEVVFFETFRNT